MGMHRGRSDLPCNGGANGLLALRQLHPVRAAGILFVAAATTVALPPIPTRDNSCCEMKIAAAAGTPTQLTVTITNVGAAAISLVRTRGERDFGIRVKSAFGNEVGRTEEGKRLLREPHEGSSLYKELRTGESFRQELDLGRIFELKSGTYGVTLTREVSVGGVRVTLESVTEMKIP